MGHAGASPADDVIGSVRNITVTVCDAVAASEFERVDPRLKGRRAEVSVTNLLDGKS